MRSYLFKGLRNPDDALRFVRRRFESVQKRSRHRMLAALNDASGGTRILDEDWDTLIVLDACRYDVFEAVNHLEGELERRRSCASSTYPFLERNFANEELYDTIYISANAMVGKFDRQVGLNVFKLIGLWGEKTDIAPLDTEEDDNTDPHSLPKPGPVVQKTLEVYDRHPDKRLIVHFLPPHTPFLVKDAERLLPDSPYRTYTAVRRGEITAQEIRDVYVENMEYVLEHVGTLVDTLDGKTVVTADHGELLGEGIPYVCRLLDTRWPWTKLGYYDYAHYGGIHVPELVEVPWLVPPYDGRRQITDAGRKEGTRMDESAIQEQLEALGYR